MKYGSFKNYASLITEGKFLFEQDLSLQDLVDNFRKVFPYAKADCNVQHFKVDGKDGKQMICKGQVQSDTHPNEHYEVTVEFYRDDIDIPFSVTNIGKVNCTCDAYRYNLSHPNSKNNVQTKPKQSGSGIPNSERNPDKVPSVCKHLYTFLLFLYNKGIIRNN
jgi:hypothetical protein